MNATNIFLQLFFNGWNENQCLFHFFECNDTRRKRDFKLLYENVLESYHSVLKNITKIVFKIFRNFSKSESFHVSTHYILIIIINQRFKFNFNKNKKGCEIASELILRDDRNLSDERKKKKKRYR